MMWLADQGVSGAEPPESRAASTVTPWAVDAAQTLGDNLDPGLVHRIDGSCTRRLTHFRSPSVTRTCFPATHSSGSPAVRSRRLRSTGVKAQPFQFVGVVAIIPAARTACPEFSWGQQRQYARGAHGHGHAHE